MVNFSCFIGKYRISSPNHLEDTELMTFTTEHERVANILRIGRFAASQLGFRQSG
jgi:hypothetical protein